MPLYIEKTNGDVNQPTNRPTDRVNLEQSAFFESLKIEKRQRFAISSPKFALTLRDKVPDSLKVPNITVNM